MADSRAEQDDSTRYTQTPPGEWELVATEGYERLTAVVGAETDDGIVSRVVLQFDPVYEGKAAAELVVPEMLLSREALGSLRDELRRWLGQSLEALAAHPFRASVDLAAHQWQTLSLAFSDDQSLISTTGQSVCRIDIDSGKLHATLSLVTDPTALEGLVQGIEAALAAPAVSEEYILVGGDHARRKASFRLRGDRLDPDAVSRATGLTPDKVHRKGEPKPPPGRGTWRSALWSLKSEGELPETASLEEHLCFLLDRLEPHAAELKAVVADQGLEADFFCGYFMEGWNNGFELTPETLARIASLDASVGFDIYGS